MRNIVKKFGEVVANNGINLDINRGEILALLGENGSGKTTLMNMLSGIYQADSGEILLDGEPVSITNPSDAIKHGIGMIHQHYKLVEVFTVAQNIILGNGDKKLDLKDTNRKVEEIWRRDLDPRRADCRPHAAGDCEALQNPEEHEG